MTQKIKQHQLLINAEQGDPKAQYLLGLTYYIQNEVDKGLIWLSEAVQQGIVEAYDFFLLNNQSHHESESMRIADLFLKAEEGKMPAQYLLGLMYYEGKEMRANREIALKWLKNVAKQGEAKAQYLLGLIYQKKELQTTLKCQQAAEKGVLKAQDFINLVNQHINKVVEMEKAQAQYLLGLMYYKGKEVEKNSQLALMWLEQLEELEVIEAQNLIEEIKREYEQLSLDDLLIRAKIGEAQAQYLLGLKYYQGEEVEKKVNTALECFYQAAVQGVVEAQNLISKIQEKTKLLKKAKKGDAQAQYSLGLMYYKGEEVEKSLQTALEWVKEAASQGLPEAQNLIEEIKREYEQLSLDELLILSETGDEQVYYFLGLKYYRGLEVRKDIDLALKWFYEAANEDVLEALNRILELEAERNKQLPLTELLMKANKGDAQAQYFLGCRYYEDEDKDIYTALEWFEQATSQGLTEAQEMISVIEKDYEQLPIETLFTLAEIGNKQAQYLLGLKYYQGEEVLKNIDMALEWFEQAAKQGLAKAQHEISVIFEKDYEQLPLETLSSLVEIGNKQAQYLLGLKYYQGKEVRKDIDRALKWFYQSADQGMIEAQNWILEFETEQDKQLPLTELLVKANKGNAQAQYLLGCRYYEDEEKDIDTALECFEQAALQGLTEAQEMISVIIETDYEQLHLETLFTRAKIGNKQAQYSLGLKYSQGLKVRKDIDMALEWFYQAAAQGMIEAQNWILELETKQKKQKKQLPLTELLMNVNKGNAQAQYLLGCRYYENKEKDIDTALKWLEQAAKQGLAKAQEMISVIIEIDYEQLPLETLFTLAEIGNKQAQYVVGLKYYQGTEVRKDIDMALKWLDQAAEQDVIKAQDLIVLIYQQTIISESV